MEKERTDTFADEDMNEDTATDHQPLTDESMGTEADSFGERIGDESSNNDASHNEAMAETDEPTLAERVHEKLNDENQTL
jgi:hypothetical protein